MTEKQYGKLVEELSPKSPIGWDCVAAFVVGGAICTLGQIFINLYKSLGLEQQDASTAASMSLVVALPIPSPPLLWSSKRKASSSVSAQRCSPLPAPSSSMACPPAWFTESSIGYVP